ncbi:MAG: leucine-rich repeat domain-containing protein [Holosporales bacterium]|nr:leucine-rich repeat domain-containing protein [Holosporales bacterium]
MTGSRLQRIEKEAFAKTGLVEIIIPASVEVLGGELCRSCKSLSFVMFEQGSRLSRIDEAVFSTQF